MKLAHGPSNQKTPHSRIAQPARGCENSYWGRTRNVQSQSQSRASGSSHSSNGRKKLKASQSIQTSIAPMQSDVDSNISSRAQTVRWKISTTVSNAKKARPSSVATAHSASLHTTFKEVWQKYLGLSEHAPNCSYWGPLSSNGPSFYGTCLSCIREVWSLKYEGMSLKEE